MKKSIAAVLAPVIGLSFLAVTQVGCDAGGGGDIEVAVPKVDATPAPATPPAKGAPGTVPPAGGGSPPGDPSQYTK